MSNVNAYRFTVENARLAFPKLWKAEAGPDGGKPNFSGAFIIPKDHAIIPKLKAGMVALAKEKWGDKAEVIYKGMAAGNKLALQDGDQKAQYDGYAGNVFFNARNPARPSVLDRNKTPLTEADGKPYAGCYVNVLIELWAQDNQWGKRINATLRGVQFVRDGDAFSAAPPPASEAEFADLGDQGQSGAPAPEAWD